MHKCNEDNNVDFDFFETEGYKSYKNERNDSSKIITKAVIEAKPKELSELSKNETNFTLKLLTLNAKRENVLQTKINDSIPSPTSSEENILLCNSVEDVTLFNCLAFNEDANDRQMFSVDDKYFSDNSQSDSTITTVSSDFTTVSRLSESDLSCGSDLSADSSVQSDELISRHNDGGKFKEDRPRLVGLSDLNVDLKLGESQIRLPEGESSENLIHETNVFIESINSEHGHSKDDNYHENQETIFNVDNNIDNESNISGGSRRTNTDIFSDKEYEITANENLDLSQCSSLSRKESISTIEERLGDISLASKSSSNLSLAKPHTYRGQNKFRSKRKEFNLTFSREELFRIERDNSILLKKIMAYSKPRSVSLNHTFNHKKTSAAINRARQQKKIEQDNYILYSKINAMSRMKKVF